MRVLYTTARAPGRRKAITATERAILCIQMVFGMPQLECISFEREASARSSKDKWILLAIYNVCEELNVCLHVMVIMKVF